MKNFIPSLPFFFIGFTLLTAASLEDLKIHNDDTKGVFHRLIRDSDLAGIQQLFTLYGSDFEIIEDEDIALAIRRGGPDIVRFLIQHIKEADPDTVSGRLFSAEDHRSRVFLESAMSAQSIPSFEILWEHGARMPAGMNQGVFSLIRNDNVDFMNYLIGKGFRPLDFDWNTLYSSSTPSHFWPTLFGSKNILKRMLELGADPNAPRASNSQMTALHLATFSESPKTLKILLDHGADVNATFNWSSNNPAASALSNAAWVGNLEMVNILLDAGAEVAIDHNRALFNASTRGDRTVYNRLLEVGAKWEGDPLAPAKKERLVLFTSNEFELSQAATEKWSEVLHNRVQNRQSVQAGEEQSVRVAIFNDHAARNIATWMQTELSQNQAVTLLERDQLDAILQEADLARTNIRRESLAEALALTPADFSLVITTHATDGARSHLFSIELLSLRTGVVLDNWMLSSDRADSAEALQNLSASARARLLSSDLSAEAVVLGLNRFRFSDGSQESLHLSNEFNLALRASLVASGFHLLEREGLQQIMMERAIAGESSSDPLATSGWILEGGIDRLEAERFRIRMRLTDASGSREETVIEGNSLPGVIPEVEAYIQAITANTPSTNFNRAQEAQRLAQQSQWAGTSGFFTQSIRLADAAWALDTENWNRVKGRLEARIRYLDTLVRLLRAERSGKGLRFMTVTFNYEYYSGLDPLNWFDFGADPEELLRMVDECYRIMISVIRKNPGNSSEANTDLDRLLIPVTEIFTWFTPIHMQDRYANGYRNAKRSGQAAYRSIYDAITRERYTNYAHIWNPEIFSALGYFFDAEEIKTLLDQYIDYLSARRIRTPHGSAATAPLGDMAKRGLIGAGPRPNFPREVWTDVAAYLRSKPDQKSYQLGTQLELSLQPPSKASDLAEAFIQDVLSSNPSMDEVQGLNMFIRTHDRGLGSAGDGVAGLYIDKRLRPFILNAYDPVLTTHHLGEYPGYNFIYKDQANKIIRDFHNPEGSLSYQHLRVTAERFLESLEEAPPTPDSIPVSQIFYPELLRTESTAERTVLTNARLLRTESYSKRNIVTHARPVFTEQSVWFVFGVRVSGGEDYRTIYRLDSEKRSLEWFETPREFSHVVAGKQGHVGIAENEKFVLFSEAESASNPGAKIRLFEKSTGTWTTLEGFTGLGNGSVFALEDGFLFLAQRGIFQERHGYSEEIRDESLVVHYNPETKEFRELAQNTKTPADYPFEKPHLFFSSLALSSDRKYFNVSGNQMRPGYYRVENFRGRVLIKDGSRSSENIGRDRFYPIQQELHVDVEGQLYQSMYNSDGTGFPFRWRAQDQEDFVFVRMDDASLKEAINGLGLASEHAEKLQEDILGFDRVRVLLYHSDIAIHYTDKAIILFERSEVENAVRNAVRKPSPESEFIRPAIYRAPTACESSSLESNPSNGNPK